MAIDAKQTKMRDIISTGLREELEEMKKDIIELVNNVIDNVASEVRQQVDSRMTNGSIDFLESEKYSNRTKPTSRDCLPSKQFLPRDSPLTDLYKNKHIRTIYNLLLATLIILLIHTAVYDIRHTGSPNLGIHTVQAGFAKFSVVLCVWPLMKASTMIVYLAFYCWGSRRFNYAPQSFLRKAWDYLWITAFIAYQILFFALPTRAVFEHDLPIACSMIILMEQVRMVMKTYAFVRSNAPRFLSFKPHSDMPAPKMPGFSKYLYFLFAPTLIYQDNYPRLNKIRWNLVLTNFIEVLTLIFVEGLIYERMLYPHYRNFGEQPIELGDLTLNMLSSMLPGLLMFLCGFYLLLHCWMNAFAELMRFADKMFYKDWWNSVSFSFYYRTWNVVVHDWLYTYVYKDVYEIITSRNKVISTCAVFAISAIMHEYIICCSCRFFYPLMLFVFGCIGLMVHLQFMLKLGGNVFIWFSLGVGSGTFVGLYCMEYFARINCPQTLDNFWDFVVPRTITCLQQWE